jgi:hypothetical protein
MVSQQLLVFHLFSQRFGGVGVKLVKRLVQNNAAGI